MDSGLVYRFYNLLFPAELDLPGQTLVSWRPIRAKGFYYCTGAAVFSDSYVGVTHQNGCLMQLNRTGPQKIISELARDVLLSDPKNEIIGGFVWGGLEHEVNSFIDALGASNIPLLGQHKDYDQHDCKDVIAVPRIIQVLMHSRKSGYLSVGEER